MWQLGKRIFKKKPCRGKKNAKGHRKRGLGSNVRKRVQPAGKFRTKEEVSM
jgi:hypothetical protein